MKSARRGSSCCKTVEVDTINVFAVQWLDNRPVTLLSTFAATDPVQEVDRFDKAKKIENKIQNTSYCFGL